MPAFKVFQFYHLPHHSYCTIEPDQHNKKEVAKDKNRRPIYDLDLPTEFEAWLFSSNPLTRVAFLFVQVVLYALRPMTVSPKPIFLEDVIGAFTQACFVGSAVYVGGFGAFVYLICAAFLGSGLHVSAMHFVAEHYMITPETAYVNDPKQG